MGPELLDPNAKYHQTVDSDCYALGMVIYEVLNERIPFHGYRNEVIPGKVLEGDRPQKPEGVEGGWFTVDVWEVLERCWMSQPGDRPNIKDILKCLEKVSSSWMPASTPATIGSLTQEFFDKTVPGGTDVRGAPPLSEVASHQPPVKLGPEEAAGTVNGVRLYAPDGL